MAQNPKDEVSNSKTGEMAKNFQNLKDLHYVKGATYRRQSGSHFTLDGLILSKLVSMAL